MKIVGLEGLGREQLQLQLQQGAKFVLFQYCISLLVVTLTRSSSIYFVKSGESRAGTGLVFSLISLLCGWWGLPWGPIRTIQSVFINFGGGKVVTKEVVAALSQPG